MKKPSSTATNLNKPHLRHFISTQDYTKKELEQILELMRLLKAARRDNAVPQLFKGKSLGMVFEQPSTRTRISFETAATILGGHAEFLSSRDIHLGQKESIEDTSRVMSRMLDVMLARVDKHQTVVDLAENATIPVINGLSDWVHPTQMMADVFTMKEHLPKGKKLSDLQVAFVGDATDVASSLMFICTKFGMNYLHIGPNKYHPPKMWIDLAKENCKKSGGKFTLTDDTNAVKGCDILIADSFYWFGQEDEKDERLSTFMPEYVIDKRLMDRAGPNTIFMHCLPGNDQRETTREVMDGSGSVIFDEAENRLTAEMALLVYFTHKDSIHPTKKVRKAHKDAIKKFLSKL